MINLNGKAEPTSRGLRLAYEPDGIDRHLVRGCVSTTIRLRLNRARWQAHATVPVTVEGLTRCMPHLGIAGGDAP